MRESNVMNYSTRHFSSCMILEILIALNFFISCSCDDRWKPFFDRRMDWQIWRTDLVKRVDYAQRDF